MKFKFHDFETYPEWYCCCVSDEEESYLSAPYKFAFTTEEEFKIKNKMRCYVSDRNDLDEIKKHLAEMGILNIELVCDIPAFQKDMQTGVLSGWNVKAFDLTVLKCALMNFTARQIYIAANLLIDPTIANRDAEHMRISQYARKGWKWQGAQAFQDLMDDSDKKGLKDQESKFGMDIRECEVPFGKTNLTPLEKAQIIYYCCHDVFACHVYYLCVAKPYVDTKLALCKTYGFTEKQAYESTNAVLSGKVLEATRQHGTTIKDPTIIIRQPLLKEYLEKWVPEEVYKHLLTSQKPIMRNMFDNKVYMADGGLHSVYTVPKVERTQGCLYVEASEEWGLYNVDASSCYPSVMLFCDAMPRGLSPTGKERLMQIYKKRLELKMKPKKEWTQDEKDFVAAAKLVLNTTYGAMGNEYLPLYDDYMRSKTCRVGQLILIALAQCFTKSIADLKIIQTNTDGILVYCRRADLQKLEELVHEFERLSNFVFEIEEDSKIWQCNVNNYIAVDKNGAMKDIIGDEDTKSKGKKFLAEIWQRGTNRIRPLGIHIIAKCQIAFYLNKTNPIQMLLEHDNVNDFVLTCTKGPTYHALVQKNRDGDLKLGKVARVIATTTQKYGQLKKQKMVEGKLQEDLCALCPDHTWIMNDALYNYHFEGTLNDRELVHTPTGMRAKIDWGYYAERLDEVLDIPWFKLKNNRLVMTNEFNLQEVK